jgi:hypothetical protein
MRLLKGVEPLVLGSNEEVNIRMTRYVKLTICAAISAVAGVAAAQSDTKLDLTPSNVQIRGGIYLPFDTTMRGISDNYAAIGVDILFPQDWIPQSKTYLSIDWLAKSLSGSHGNVFPVCINQKWYGKTYDNMNTYIFVGAGATFFDIYASDVVFGARGGIGIDLGTNIFLEGTYYWSDASTGNVSNIGTAFYLGYRW